MERISKVVVWGEGHRKAGEGMGRVRAQEDLEGMEMTEEDTENKRAEEGQRSTESSPRHEEAVMGRRVGERYWESGTRNWA